MSGCGSVQLVGRRLGSEVRGQVFGCECLAEVLGPDVVAPTPVPPKSRDIPLALATASVLASLAATFLPWARFGVGAGLSGAWGFKPLRWSSLAAFGAASG